MEGRCGAVAKLAVEVGGCCNAERGSKAEGRIVAVDLRRKNRIYVRL